MMRAKSTAVLAGCSVLAMLLSGCGQQHPPAEIVTPTAKAAPSTAATPTVDAPCDSDAAVGGLPDGFEPVAVHVCESVIAQPASSAKRLTGDLADILNAFAEANDPAWPGACSAVGWAGPEYWFEDAHGAVVHAAYPADGCGMPKNSAVTRISQAAARLDAAH